MLAGRDALAGAAGRREAVLRTAQAALTGRLHLVHHGQAGLDGGRQVSERYLTGGRAPAGNEPGGRHPERRVAAAVAVRRLAGPRGPSRGLSDQA